MRRQPCGTFLLSLLRLLLLSLLVILRALLKTRVKFFDQIGALRLDPVREGPVGHFQTDAFCGAFQDTVAGAVCGRFRL